MDRIAQNNPIAGEPGLTWFDSTPSSIDIGGRVKLATDFCNFAVQLV